jgi:hypothetical protein
MLGIDPDTFEKARTIVSAYYGIPWLSSDELSAELRNLDRRARKGDLFDKQQRLVSRLEGAGLDGFFRHGSDVESEAS